MLTSTDCQPALAGFTISDGNMKEDIKVWDWSPLAVIPWKSRQLEESGSLCTQWRVSDPLREGFIPSYMDAWGRQDESPQKGLSLCRVLPPLQRGLTPPRSIWCLLQARGEESLLKHFKAVSPQDDPAQSSISPCAVCFCLVSLYHPAKNVLINITGKRSASGEKLCLCQNCPPFLIFEIFILITVSQRSHILPQNTSPLFKPTKQLPCFNSKVVPNLQSFEFSFTIYYYISSTRKCSW